ncbi:hypothetical protein ABFS82_10G160900 [Erythranthe guttata]
MTSCSHVGLVEEGMELFESMEQENCVGPTREQFSCVVDLLARAGRIEEAKAFIVMWKTLLAACRNGGNLEVGNPAAENILRIDPFNLTAHVLLCGIYASAGEWSDVAALRSSMREKGVWKVPGRSWIEIEDRIHVFSAEDGLQFERGKIFEVVADS